MLARLFVFFGGLFVLALLALLVAPHFIDWTSYRASFEREASAVLGRPVTVRGQASVRILPFPSVTFTDVAVGASSAEGPQEPAQEAAQEPAMTIETFSMDAELAPLLHGEFLIFDTRLVRPRGRLDVAADGTLDWAVRPSTPVEASRIALEHVSITDGELTLRHAGSNTTHTVTNLDATLSARSLAGPWRAEARARFDGRPATISASTGTAEAGSLRLNLDIAPDDAPLRVTADGSLRLDENRLSYTGKFRLAPSQTPSGQTGSAQPASGEPAVAQTDTQPRSGQTPAGQGGTAGGGIGAATESATPARAADPAYRVSGAFALDGSALTVSQFRFETGPRDSPYAAEGTASLVFDPSPRFALEANGEQVRLDSLDAANPPEGDAAPVARGTPAERLAALEAALRALPSPTIPGTVTLNLPALVAGGTTVRDLHLEASPDAGAWRVATLSAALPGRTTLEASGRLASLNGLSFDGALLVAVAQPSGLAAWLGEGISDAVRRLPSAGFRADVRLSPSRQEVTNLELRLGDTLLTGSLSNIEPPAGAPVRPALRMDLAGSNVDLRRVEALAGLFGNETGASLASGRDIDVALNAAPVTLDGVTAGALDGAATLQNGTLTLQRLRVANLSGATLQMDGALANLDTTPSGTLNTLVTADDLHPFLDLLLARANAPEGWRAWSRRLGATPDALRDSRLSLALQLGNTGRKDDTSTGSLFGKATLTGALGTTQVTASAEASQPLDAQAFSLDASLSNETGAALLALAGLPSHASDTGSATVTLSLAGTSAAGYTTKAEWKAAQGFARFDGTLDPAPSGLSASGTLALVADDIEPWLIAMGLDLPGLDLGAPADFKAQASVGDGLAIVDAIQGTLDEEAVSGTLNIDLRGQTPDITGQLAFDAFDGPQVASLVLGPHAFDAGPDGSLATPFQARPSLPFNATLDVSAGVADLGALGLLYNPAFRLSLSPDRLAVSDLAAVADDGQLRLNGDLRNSGGTGLLSLQLDLRRAALADPFQGGGLQGTADVSASLTANGASVSALLASLSGSGTARVSDLHIAGLNENALDALLEAGDAADRAPTPAEVAAFAPAIARDGAFSTPRADLAFTIANGLLRAPPVTLETPRATLDADLRADLRTGAVQAKGRLRFLTSPDDTLVGSDPALDLSFDGPFATTALGLDTAPLAQFLAQRALEKEQARVEALQDALLEKQRLRRENRLYEAQAAERARALAEQRRVDAAARQRALERLAETRAPTPANPPEPAPSAPRPAPRPSLSDAALPEPNAARRAAPPLTILPPKFSDALSKAISESSR